MGYSPIFNKVLYLDSLSETGSIAGIDNAIMVL